MTLGGPTVREDGAFGPLPETAAEARATATHIKDYTGVARASFWGRGRASPPCSRRRPPASWSPAPTATTAPYPMSRSPYKRDASGAASGSPERTSVVSSTTGPSDDGVATGLEILASDFRGTELVVLAACATSYGEFQTTQGLVGLNLAFHLAGAKTVLGSLGQYRVTRPPS